MKSQLKPDNRNSGDGGSDGKIFIGGLPKDTRDDEFNRHFGKYGDITDSVIMKDRSTGQPRGFGFITYADPSVVDRVIEDTHIFNGKQVEVKRTTPKGSSNSKDFKTKKLYVGGFPSSLDDDELKSFFSKYGKVVEHQIVRDNETNRSRRFGFVIFDSEKVVEELVASGKTIDMNGTQVEVKKAESKKPLNQPPNRFSKSKPRSFPDEPGRTGNDGPYDSFDGGHSAGPYRPPGRVDEYSGYDRYRDFGGYGGYGNIGGGYRGESSLGYNNHYGSYGDGGYGGYSRGEGYRYRGPGFDRGYDPYSGSDPGLSYDGSIGRGGGYSGGSRYASSDPGLSYDGSIGRGGGYSGGSRYPGSDSGLSYDGSIGRGGGYSGGSRYAGSDSGLSYDGSIGRGGGYCGGSRYPGSDPGLSYDGSIGRGGGYSGGGRYHPYSR